MDRLPSVGQLSVHTLFSPCRFAVFGYVAAMQFTPARLARSIRAHIPDFRIDYDVEPMRQRIADSWPMRLDDTAAREEWGWSPRYGLEPMVTDMLNKLGEKLATRRGR